MRVQECECSFCGGAVSFEKSKAGELVNCQGCGMETVLFVAGIARPYPREEYFLQATNIGWSRSPLGFRNVVGSVVNTSEKNFDWVRIEFTLVNREATPVGGTSDCLIHFPAKGIWRFQAPVFQAEAVGVGAPLISCEYGKIWVQPQRSESQPPKPTSALPPTPAPALKPASRRAKGANEWTGLRITGGMTGTANHQPGAP